MPELDEEAAARAAGCICGGLAEVEEEAASEVRSFLPTAEPASGAAPPGHVGEDDQHSCRRQAWQPFVRCTSKHKEESAGVATPCEWQKGQGVQEHNKLIQSR